ncbi:MAG: isoleucine--tRNA ligase [Candidatus Aminicenantes bacterium]|nr:isoleucine--tRNA ligase [Candidatus Aminicenantes bacterium]
MPEKPDYKKTLNLPRTPFSMKAKLAEKEPVRLERWAASDLYGRILKKRKMSPAFVLHDGPPYANGRIHLGTALNKILKDFIVKSKAMQGFLAPYLPGWDCHGLPIEIHVDKLLGEQKRDMSIIDFREECRKYALKFIHIQREEFVRLGVFGEWAEPYLTMTPGYEAAVLRSLAAFFVSGDVYKGLRPVHWCPHCQTALAEAEIEYKDRASPSIYVKFPLLSDLSVKFPALAGKRVFVLIWTTTPWTLPANLAVAFHPDHEYVAVEVGAEVYILAKRLLPIVSEELGFSAPKILATFPGKEMDRQKARHPWIDRESLLVLANYVTLEDGTGCVHTAPGHGHEDYLTGLAYGLEIYTPVDSEGKFIPQVERYGGLNVFTANPRITADMAKEGSLLKEGTISHSYPHCWRCKNPVIFRATSQWFISMDKSDLRPRALEAIKKVKWIPPWGEERIANMMSARPDWCISRQRKWGVPIPAFECRACGQILASAEITLRMADLFSREGSNAWFAKRADELLPAGTKCPRCGGGEFEKENNILDVWFEAGSSHAVLGQRPDLPWPADIYIEGHDQYRGWFNSSLLIGVGAKGGSPYRTCITHGFVLDEQGRAMSKSLGNVIEPGDIISKDGAEVLRLWVAMLNFKEDTPFGPEILSRLEDAYRKIRNTWRFLLGNVSDFDPGGDRVGREELLPLDLWALERAAEVGRRVLKAYEDYEYHIVFHSVYNFFTVDLSAFYLDVLKDRLYCSARKSVLRRSGQTVLFDILRESLILMAPILPFTTDEAWESLPPFAGKEDSVHLETFPSFEERWPAGDLGREMNRLLILREAVLKELEKAREGKLIGNSLEARVHLAVPAPDRELVRKYEEDLSALFIVSAVTIEPGAAERLGVRVSRAEGDKCQRCWNYSPAVGRSRDFPELCPRCEAVVREMT